MPLQRRLVQNEAVQEEHEADEAYGAERSEIGDNSISEGIDAEIQGDEHENPLSASFEDGTSPSSTVKDAADEGLHEASSAAASTAASAGATTETNFLGPSFSTNYRRENLPPCSTLYVGNISFDTTEEQITKTFESAGQVVSVKILKDARGFSRG